MPKLTYEERFSIGDKHSSTATSPVTPFQYKLAIRCLNIATFFALLADKLLKDTHHIELKCSPK